jgi:hypothetical protein
MKNLRELGKAILCSRIIETVSQMPRFTKSPQFVFKRSRLTVLSPPVDCTASILALLTISEIWVEVRKLNFFTPFLFNVKSRDHNIGDHVLTNMVCHREK